MLPFSGPHELLTGIGGRDGRELKMGSANDSIGKILGLIQTDEILVYSLEVGTPHHPALAPKRYLQFQIELWAEKGCAKGECEPCPCESA
jgi:hypothetical protein